MSRREADTVVPREQRKQDLLLASRLARTQMTGAFNEIADRADAVAYRVVQVRAWVSSPLVWMSASTVGAFVLTLTLRRGRRLRWLRWGWLAWRVWRSSAPALARYRAGPG